MATPGPGSRASLYAEQLEEVSTSLLALLEGCSPREWRSAGPESNASIGILASGLALDLANAWELIAALAARSALPPSRGEQRRIAAPGPATGQGGDRGDTIDLLRVNVAALGHLIAGLSDDQLSGADPAQRGDGVGVGAQGVIETRVLGSLQEALSQIQRAIGNAPRTPGGIGKI
jgi:hypothetical protein